MTFSVENFFYFAFGIAITVLVARRFASRKEIYFHVFSYPVFSRRSLSDVAGFEIKFNGEKVEEVWRHVVFVWNGGNQPIWQSDLSSTNPLRLQFGEGTDLSVEEIIGKSDNFSGKLVLKGDGVLLDFPHMDAGEGISFVVLEAMRNEDRIWSRPKLEGHVVGLTSPPKELEPLSPSEAVGEIKFAGGCAVFLIALSAAVGLWIVGAGALWPPNKLWLIPLALIAVIGLASDFFGIGKYYRAKALKVPETFSRHGRSMMRFSYMRQRQLLLPPEIVELDGS
jgi:hypothetical protein